jgi:hypothetical protein
MHEVYCEPHELQQDQTAHVLLHSALKPKDLVIHRLRDMYVGISLLCVLHYETSYVQFFW